MVTLAEFIDNLTTVMTGLISMFTSVMAVFMEPPLNFFVGIGVFTLMVGLVAKYLMGRRKG